MIFPLLPAKKNKNVLPSSQTEAYRVRKQARQSVEGEEGRGEEEKERKGGGGGETKALQRRGDEIEWKRECGNGRGSKNLRSEQQERRKRVLVASEIGREEEGEGGGVEGEGREEGGGVDRARSVRSSFESGGVGEAGREESCRVREVGEVILLSLIHISEPTRPY